MLHSSGGVLSSRPRPSLSLVSHDLSPVHGGRIEDVQVREMAILEAQTTEHVYFVAHYGGSVTPSGDVSLNAVLHPSPWDGVRVDPLPAVGEKFQDMDRTNRGVNPTRCLWLAATPNNVGQRTPLASTPNHRLIWSSSRVLIYRSSRQKLCDVLGSCHERSHELRAPPQRIHWNHV